MFRKVVRRFTLGALLVVSVAALTAATGGSAELNLVSPTPTYSHDGSPQQNKCPGAGINERHYCLVLTTYNNLKKSGGVEVDLTLQNYDQSTLSNPVTTLNWDSGDNSLAGLAKVSTDGPASCSAPPTGGPVVCKFPNLPGLGSSAVIPAQPQPCPVPPASGPICSTVKLFFSVNATEPKVSFTATADVKESQPNGANVDQQQVAADMVFGTSDSQDATIALPSSGSKLEATVPQASSVKFNGGSRPFLAQFQADQSNPANPGVCFPGINCTGLQLTTDLSAAPSGTFSSALGHQILWTADIVSTNTNILAVHTYDPVTITPAQAPNTLATAGTRFANCDGVTFSPLDKTPSGLSPDTTYFVINKTPNTTTNTTTFQVASSPTGKALPVSGSGTFSGSCIRVIGDKPASETTKACTASNPAKPTDAPAEPKTPPVLCVAKVPNTTPATVRVYLWDDSNGHVGY